MNELESKADFLQRKNDELIKELKRKTERLRELEITVKVLRRLSGEGSQDDGTN